MLKYYVNGISYSDGFAFSQFAQKHPCSLQEIEHRHSSG